MLVVYINEKSLMEYHFESSNLKVFKMRQMKMKESYYSPEVEVMRISPEAVIAASGEVEANVSNPFSGNKEEQW